MLKLSVSVGSYDRVWCIEIELTDRQINQLFLRKRKQLWILHQKSARASRCDIYLSIWLSSKVWQSSHHSLLLLCVSNSQLKGLVDFLPGMVHVFCSRIKGLMSARARFSNVRNTSCFSCQANWFSCQAIGSAVRPLVPSVVHDSHPSIPSMFPPQKWILPPYEPGSGCSHIIHSSSLECICNMLFRYTDLFLRPTILWFLWGLSC
jgi:hypothetical protein